MTPKRDQLLQRMKRRAKQIRRAQDKLIKAGFATRAPWTLEQLRNARRKGAK